MGKVRRGLFKEIRSGGIPGRILNGEGRMGMVGGALSTALKVYPVYRLTGNTHVRQSPRLSNPEDQGRRL
jgi:hypothetical protein